MASKILTFIKAIDPRYFDSFMDIGQVCMNTAKWFRAYEAQDSVIGDMFEGVKMACGKDFTVRIADPIFSYESEEERDREFAASNWTEVGKGVNLRLIDENDNANIFSLYAITQDASEDKSGNYLVSKKFLDEFPNHRFVLFLDPMAFLSKMETFISGLGKVMKSGMVEYYKLDEKLVQNLSYFHKPDNYSYQNEFRLVFMDDNADRRIISIGSLNGVCVEIDITKKYYFEIIDDDHFLIKSID